MTVISVWHNRQHLVRDSAHSIMNQTLRPVRILLVDDGSDDDTGLELDRSAQAADSNVEVIHQSNLGLSASLEKHLRTIETDYIALHGAGDFSDPTRLSKQVRLAEETGAAVVGCGVGWLTPDGQRRGVKSRPKDAEQGSAAQGKVPRPGTHGAAMIRTEFLQACGGYRRALRYSQDADLWLRISAHGPFRNVPEILYWKYSGTGDTVRSNPRKRFLQALYGELARQCHEDRHAGRPDLVDLHGDDAIHFLRRTTRLVKRLERSVGSGEVDTQVAESVIWSRLPERTPMSQKARIREVARKLLYKAPPR